MVGNLVMITAVVVLWTAMGLESGVDDGRWLQQLYTATGGGGWYSDCTSGWNMTAGAYPCNGSTSLWSSRVHCILGRVFQLHLYNCNLRGTLPELDSSSGGALSQLQLMWLNNNQISGTLPASFGNLSSLKDMSLYINQLSGTLPASWSNLSSLQYMDLHSNQLSGTLPASWATLRSITNMSFRLNFLSGVLPASWYNDNEMLCLKSIDAQLNCLSVSSAQSNAAQWNWWLSKTSVGTGLLLQRATCHCGFGQLSTLDGYWCEDCPAGYYCPNTSISVPCPAGTYNPSTGSQFNDACLSCPAGMTSNATGQKSSSTCNISTASESVAAGGSVVSRATSTTTSTAAVVAGMPIALLATGGSIGGSFLQRSLLQLRLSGSGSSSSCATSLDSPLDPASSPTQLRLVGTSEYGAYLRGAVVGNVILIVGCGCCAGGIALFVRRVSGPSSRKHSSRFGGDWRSAATTIRLPGLLATPFLFLLQPTVSSSLGCIVALPLVDSGIAMNVPMGIIGCGACAAGSVWCTLSVLRAGSACEAVPRRRLLQRTQTDWHALGGAGVIQYLFVPSCEWRSRSKNFVRQYGTLFEGYRRGRHWFLCVEMSIAVACGVIGGLQSIRALGSSAASCRGLVGALLAVNVVALLCTAVLRPYQRGWELLMFGVSNALGVAWGAVALLGDDSSAEELASSQVWLQVAQLGSALLETLYHHLSTTCRKQRAEAEATDRHTSSPSGRLRERRRAAVPRMSLSCAAPRPPPHQFQLSDRNATCEALIRRICEQQQQQQQQQEQRYMV